MYTSTVYGGPEGRPSRMSPRERSVPCRPLRTFPRERSVPRRPSRTFPRERSVPRRLSRTFPRERSVPRRPLRTFPRVCSVPHRPSRLLRVLAPPHSRACAPRFQSGSSCGALARVTGRVVVLTDSFEYREN